MSKIKQREREPLESVQPSILNEPHAERKSVRSAMNRQQTGIDRLVLRPGVRHLDFRTALRSRASGYIFVMTSPGGNQMGIVDRGDCCVVSKASK